MSDTTSQCPHGREFRAWHCWVQEGPRPRAERSTEWGGTAPHREGRWEQQGFSACGPDQSMSAPRSAEGCLVRPAGRAHRRRAKPREPRSVPVRTTRVMETVRRVGRDVAERSPGRIGVGKGWQRTASAKPSGQRHAGGSGTPVYEKTAVRQQKAHLGRAVCSGDPGTCLDRASGERTERTGWTCKAGHQWKNPENPRPAEGRAWLRSRPRLAKAPGKRFGQGLFDPV